MRGYNLNYFLEILFYDFFFFFLGISRSAFIFATLINFRWDAIVHALVILNVFNMFVNTLNTINLNKVKNISRSSSLFLIKYEYRNNSDTLTNLVNLIFLY